MRARLAASVVACALAGCVRGPLQQPAIAAPEFSTRPSALGLEVRAGLVQGLIPARWEAEPLPQARYPGQGFVASPSLKDWERGAGTVGGAEAFWVDEGDAEVSAEYFYLVARGPAIGSLAYNKGCQLLRQRVYLDDRPDFTGRSGAGGDYVTSGRGVCGPASRIVRWEYVVVAPGYGPIRKLGIPTSGLYVVIAAASGRNAPKLLRRIIDAMRFRDTSISEIIQAARHLQQ